MIIHNFDPVLFDLGFFQIRWYSIAYIVGIILGWIYAARIIKEMAKKNNCHFFLFGEIDFNLTVASIVTQN
jgi:prolipoprotein diacylglyceryltransferase